MTPKRVLVCLVPTMALSIAMAQTPPIKPNTPDVVVPPAVTLPSPPVQDPNTQGAPLSADEAVAIALRLQPNVAIARYNVQAAQGRTQQARAGLGPTVNVAGGVNTSTTFRGGGGSGGSGGTGGSGTGGTGGGGGSTGLRSNATVSVAQLLFDFGRTRDEVRQQAALERAQMRVLDRVQLDTIAATKQAFYNYVSAVELVTVSESNLANRQAQLDLANARLMAGLGAPSDYVQAKTAVAEAVIALTTARQSASVARVALAQQMGVDPRTPINPGPSAEPNIAGNDVNALVDEAMRQRPELQELRERIAAAGYNLSAVRKGNSPSLSLTANVLGSGTDPLENQSGTVGLSIGWPIFDSGLVAGRVREARANQASSQVQLTQTQQQVVTDVSQAWVSLRTAEQNLATAQVELANATELVRIAEGRYRGGVGSFLDVNTAQSSLYAAQRNVATTIGNLQAARAQLARALGRSPTTPAAHPKTNG